MAEDFVDVTEYNSTCYFGYIGMRFSTPRMLLQIPLPKIEEYDDYVLVYYSPTRIFKVDKEYKSILAVSKKLFDECYK